MSCSINDIGIRDNVNSKVNKTSLSDGMQRIAGARHHDPFDVLGRHPVVAESPGRGAGEGVAGSQTITVFAPHTREMSIRDGAQLLPMARVGQSDFFQWTGAAGRVETYYRLVRVDDAGRRTEFHDPYSFPVRIADFDLHLFGEGRHLHIYRVLGAHFDQIDGIAGVRFATWAPNAERVSVIGDFNEWDGRRHPMRSRGAGGVWELFIPEIEVGALYKFELRNRDRGDVLVKSDPYGRRFEMRPATSSLVEPESDYAWQDQAWMDKRAGTDLLHAPLSIYEVHLGSWQRGVGNEFLGYRELARRLVSHVKSMGFTHIELLPITEHPFDASWGYQTTGYFAPTSRFGSPDDFRWFVDHCHNNDIGVLIDWVPAHFPKDAHALARFDGSALYEHEDPRRGEHRDWGTLIFNFGRNEVRNFLLASALYWLEEYHIDGLRVDAVASMLYLDYSRDDGDWLPNEYGGNENLEAVAFLRELNEEVHGRHSGAMVVAEESTAWPMVSRPTWLGGLGFTMKWNMGFMNDSLAYIEHEPVHRQYHHQMLTFGLLYAFTENFVLPYSHDEVVHMKGSMLAKMPGDDWQRFANLRLLYSFMYTQPGKKLLFMGSEFAQPDEWNCEVSLDWSLFGDRRHQGVARLLADLNRLHRHCVPLYELDFDGNGFEWLDCNDAPQSVVAYLRKSSDGFVVVVMNFTPVVREAYRIGVPVIGSYRELLNSDAALYGGSNVGNGGRVEAVDTPWMGRPASMDLTLPPLAGLVLELVEDA